MKKKIKKYLETKVPSHLWSSYQDWKKDPSIDDLKEVWRIEEGKRYYEFTEELELLADALQELEFVEFLEERHAQLQHIESTLRFLRSFLSNKNNAR